MVDESLLEMVGAIPPVLLQVKAQETRSHLSGPIRNITSRLQISLDGIDDRDACLAFSPETSNLRVVSPLAV